MSNQLPIVLIVGPHRSGTSFLTQVVSVLGFDLGKTLMLPSYDNPRGFWENEKIVAAHDELIKQFDKDWTTIAGLPKNWVKSSFAKDTITNIQDILETDFHQDQPWLIKDPRLCVMFPIWKEVSDNMNRPLKVVTILRSPQAASQSIQTRNHLSPEFADGLIVSHIQEMHDNLCEQNLDSLIYESLITKTGGEILEILKDLLGGTHLTSNNNIASQIERLVLSNTYKDIESSRLHQVYMEITGGKTLIDSSMLEMLINQLSDADMSNLISKIKLKSSLLDEKKQLVSLTQRELDDYLVVFEKHELVKEQLNELEELKSLNSEYQTKNTELLDEIKNSIESKNELRKVTRDRDVSLDIAESQLFSLQADLNSSANLAQEEKKQLMAELTHVRGEFDSANHQVEILDQRFKQREEELKSAINEKEILTNKLEAMSGDLAIQKANFGQKEEELKSLIEDNKIVVSKLNISKQDVTEQKKLLKQKELELEKANGAKGAMEKKMQKSVRAVKRKLKAVNNNIDSQTLKINELQLDIEEKNKALKELTDRANGLFVHLEKSNGELFSERERRQDIEAKFAELLRIKEMQDTTIKFDNTRSEMIENTLSTRIRDLEAKLDFYEKAPFKAGLKKSTFSTLRTLRRGLPLPESMKMKIAKSMSSTALYLQPPPQHSLIPKPDLVSGSNDINFAFKETDTPVISIVIPVYNEISQTIACLESIYQQNVSVDYEVILADDCSPDPYHAILKEIPGLRYFRNKENLHFLQNCNQNALHARGEYIVFLNNDTIVKPGWLQALYQTFFEHGDVGIAGSKLIYPSGELQEAGGIVWEDASGWNWGKGQNASHPLYNFARDADYVSGASLMIKTDLWREIGGFNENLEKAYYEDTDLCFRVRSMGYRVIYQPFSEVIHIEGLSSGNDLNAGAKQYQLVNQEIFKDTWESTLRHHLPNAETPFLASDRNARGHVLYFDAVTPEPDKDSGSVDAFYSMRILIEQGYRVHFAPLSNFAYWDQATVDLQKMGVECIYHPFYSNLTSFLEDRGDMFDYIVVSRPECAERGLETVLEYCPSAKIIYNTVDLHFIRMEREAKTLGRDDIKIAAKDMKKKEIGYIENTDATIVLSEVECKLLSKKPSIKDKLWIIPLIRAESHRLVEYSTTKDIVFIGGYRHQPNIDAVKWLVNDIWPEIRKVLPGVNLHICGSSMPPYFEDFADDDIFIKGFVSNLDDLLSTTRLTIAPLRFGAGLKGKVASSIGAGVPCIGTPTAFEGMAIEGLSDVKFETSTAKGFAKLAKALYNDEEAWTKASLAGVKYHNENYAYQQVAKNYRKMLASLVD